MKVRFVMPYQGSECVCLDTELPFVPLPGSLIWELPGTDGWAEPFICSEEEAPVYLAKAGVLVISEDSTEGVTEEEVTQLREAGWYLSGSSYGTQA